MTKRYLYLAGAMMLVPAVGQAQTTTSAPAPATAAKAPTVGATIMDSAGVSIGTVDSITPQAVVINTGSTKVAVPPTSIGSTAKGFALSITKAQLDAAQAQQQQQATASVQSRLVAGATVNGLNGAMLGTVKANDGTNVTLTTAEGEAKLPVSGFAPGPNNTIVVGLTADQLRAAMGGAGASGAAPSDTAPGDTASPTPAAPATSAGAASSGSTTTSSPMTPATTTAPAPTATPSATTSTTTTTTTKKTRR